MSAPSSNAPSPVPPGDGGDWRSSIPQSSRNKEVREISTLLAQLEPGATPSSKLMLAMRFEDGVFTSAKSYADYRKKLDKRLRKLQKTYQGGRTPPPTTTTADSQAVVLAELRKKYGDALQFIVEHAPEAIRQTGIKKGEDAAKHLQAHTSNAFAWAMQLGMETPHSSKGTLPRLDGKALEKLKEYLATRVENIRSHVMKQAKYDQFLQENLEKMEARTSPAVMKALSVSTQRRLKREGLWEETTEPLSYFQPSYEKAILGIPPPSRLESSQRDTSVAHIERLRSCSTAIVAYQTIPEMTPDVPRRVISKCYDSVLESLEVLQDLAPKLIPSTTTSKVQLEDAWTKVMELEEEQPDVGGEVGSDEPAAKRLKTGGGSVTFKARVLGTSGRRIPVNLLPSLKRKRAHLVERRPPHLIMDFDEAFTMTIHLCPLLVTIRAFDTASAKETNRNKNNSSITWTSATDHLPDKLSVWGVQGTRAQLGNVVERRLQYASAHATQVLRRLFRQSKMPTSDFELEIREGSALLQFVNLARQTFHPSFVEEP